MQADVRLIEITDSLPTRLASLAEQARNEGHRHLDRLIADWRSGATRFDRPGEMLLAAFVTEELVGVVGLTVEPKLRSAFRMRRFYVAPQRRGHGIGRELAERLIRKAEMAEALTVNAGSGEAARFWERLGFARMDGDRFTHTLWLRGQ